MLYTLCIYIQPAEQHWILDGFPRTLGQGKLLAAHLRYVIFLHIFTHNALTVVPHTQSTKHAA